VRPRRPPAGLLIPALVALGVIVLPLVGLIQRAPWSSLGSQLSSRVVRQALGLSIRCSLSAVALSLVLGVPLAWLLARTRFPGRALVRALVTVPMVLPPVVGGVALLYAFGRRGFAGHVLERWTGITLAFTTNGAILAETFVALPFLIIAAEAGFRQVDRRYEDAAATLGAGPWRRFWRVTLPLVLPSLTAGAALAWARALGEFGATITFAGNLQGKTQTMPLEIFLAFENRPGAGIALSLVLVAVSLVVLVTLRSRWLRPLAAVGDG
jgi:molybdate transport system permease protein